MAGLEELQQNPVVLTPQGSSSQLSAVSTRSEQRPSALSSRSEQRPRRVLRGDDSLSDGSEVEIIGAKPGGTVQDLSSDDDGFELETADVEAGSGFYYAAGFRLRDDGGPVAWRQMVVESTHAPLFGEELSCGFFAPADNRTGALCVAMFGSGETEDVPGMIYLGNLNKSIDHMKSLHGNDKNAASDTKEDDSKADDEKAAIDPREDDSKADDPKAADAEVTRAGDGTYEGAPVCMCVGALTAL